jgi:tetratricopeptide (TPR) repeat protein
VAAVASVPKQAYTRAQVQRVLGISERQIRSWEKQSFIQAAEVYTFADLLALRTLLGLRNNNIAGAQIRRAIAAVRERLSEVRDPLTELKLYSEGRKIRVQLAGAKMESLSGQLLLDFDQAEIEKLLAFPAGDGADRKSGAHKKRVEAEHWFEKGLELEQMGAPLSDIVSAYKRAVELDAASAGALVNLGTVYFNVRDFREAERYYRKALEVDPKYALAHFNLGNLFDEKGDRAKALAHYQQALEAHSGYADAHYNLALLLQSKGDTMKAVRHWKAYLRIDPNSSWSAIARRELGKLRDSAIVRRPGE